MPTRTRVAAVLLMCGLSSACHLMTGPDENSKGGKTISSTEEAKAIFSMLRGAGSGVNQKVSVNFKGTVFVTGTGGTAAVTGSKTSSTSSSSSSTTSTSAADLQIMFSGFQTGSLNASGSMSYNDYSDSRTACSSSSCASSSHHSTYVKGSSLAVTFDYNGATYSDRVSVDGAMESGSSQWSVTVTNGAGQKFSFTTY